MLIRAITRNVSSSAVTVLRLLHVFRQSTAVARQYSGCMSSLTCDHSTLCMTALPMTGTGTAISCSDYYNNNIKHISGYTILSPSLVFRHSKKRRMTLWKMLCNCLCSIVTIIHTHVVTRKDIGVPCPLSSLQNPQKLYICETSYLLKVNNFVLLQHAW